MDMNLKVKEQVSSSSAMPEQPKAVLSPFANWLHTAADLLLVLTVVGFYCFYRLGSPSVNFRDETTHILATQEMLFSKHWWLPSIDGYPYFNKPPFKMWLSFIPITLFGQSNFSFRFLDAMFGVLSCTALYVFGRFIFRSRVAGILAAFLLIGCESYVFGHGVRKAVQDSGLIFFSTAALVVFFRGFCETDIRKQKIFYVICGVFAGLAIFTKSAAGLMPLIVMAVFALVARMFREAPRVSLKQLLLIPIIAVTIPALYFIPHFLFTPGAFQTAIGQEVWGRATSGYHNQDKFFFYFIRLFRDRQAVPPELIVLGVGFAVWQIVRRRRLEWLFLIIWACLPVLLFTIVPSRLTWYISPAFPAMSLLAAGSLQKVFVLANAGSTKQRIFAVLLLLLGLSLAGSHHFRIVRALYRLPERSPFDRLTETALQEAQSKPRKVLVSNMPELDRDERVYFNMLRPYVELLEERGSAANLQQIKEASLIFTDIDGFNKLAKQISFESYMFFPPDSERKQWLVVLGLVPEVFREVLTPTRRLYDFGGEWNTSYLYGIEAPKSNYRLPYAAVSGTGAAIPFPGDAALKRLGAKLILNLSTASGTAPLRVQFSLNDRILQTAEVRGGDFIRLDLETKPEDWRIGTNVFFISPTALDGSRLEANADGLLLNWISFRLNQKAEVAVPVE